MGVNILNPTDALTDSIQMLDYAHHEIHAGDSFIVSDVQAVDTTTIKWMIVTPDTTKEAHTIFDINATGEAFTVITEGADRTAGTAITAINRNRSGTPAASTTTISRAPTGGATDGATTIFQIRNGATGVGSKTLQGGGNRGLNEYVLKPNTKYVVSVTTYAAVYVSAAFEWYEHTNTL